MISLLFSLKHWFGLLGQTMESIVKVMLLSRSSARLGQAARTTLVLLGNGPSLKTTMARHPGLLLDKDALCVNMAPISEGFIVWKPNYYLLSAPEAFLANADQQYRDQWKALFDHMAEVVDWPLTCFLPQFARKSKTGWDQKLKQNPNITLCYFNTTPAEGFRWVRHLAYNRQWGMPRPHNVMIPSLMMGLRMNYKNLVMIGAEHSWLPSIQVDENNVATVGYSHFYADNEMRAPMHQRGQGTRKLHEILHKFMLTFAGYFPIRAYAESREQKVWNATPDSFIDALDRLNLEEFEKQGYRFAETD